MARGITNSIFVALAGDILDRRFSVDSCDPKMVRAPIRPKRDIEDIKLIGELRRPLSTVFADDPFAHGELIQNVT
jgi:hypothetical protein